MASWNAHDPTTQSCRSTRTVSQPAIAATRRPAGASRCHLLWLGLLIAGCVASGSPSLAGAETTDASATVESLPGERMIRAYFRQETARLQDACLADIQTLADWQQRREGYRQQLQFMLGLDPWPDRTDLQATVTGVTEEAEFRVERLHFQSRPGLYVTGNLYLPQQLDQPAPAILYVCGHGAVKRDGVSYGNKVHYQHHGAWFARHGYVCLAIDTLQLGEIEGIHHGTYRYDMWWWLNRGFTPAGVEAWNCVRALDYLQSRPEVDAERLGVTGRSGGGAYSWWIAALDDRIKAAVPVAGITDLENHVVDGCVEGHCDCMYFVNTYQWDYPLVAALVAPRPLLISNTDRDSIFPLEGVLRTHAKVRKIYELYGAGDQLALQITAGPHQDTQELRIHAFRWFDQHLLGKDRLIERPAIAFFEPPQLQVFAETPLPSDERNTTIHESFVPQAESSRDARPPADWRMRLEQLVFRAWPTDPAPMDVEAKELAAVEGLQIGQLEYTSQAPFRLPIYLLRRSDRTESQSVTLQVLDESTWPDFAAALAAATGDATGVVTAEERAAGQRAWAAWRQRVQDSDQIWACLPPRGIGPTQWDPDPKKQRQDRRRFYLLGQTLDGMRIWDVRRGIQALDQFPRTAKLPVQLRGQGPMAGVALYAALFEPRVQSLDAQDLPASHREGPFLLNVARIWDLPEAVVQAKRQMQVTTRSSP